MPQQVVTATENNFTKGLITEATGLNFPENAATDTNNCTYTLIGDVMRREGINNETNGTTRTANRTGFAVSSYKWNNAGGDGLSQIIVTQVGNILSFYLSSAATTTSPISTQLLGTTVDISTYKVGTLSAVQTQECQYADGNGYLIVYHPACDPVYVTYAGGTITSGVITVSIRDFVGTKETPVTPVTTRPSVLNNDHLYNLLNQGWTKGSGAKTATTVGNGPVMNTGAQTFTLTATTPFSTGDVVTFFNVNPTFNPIYIPSGTAVMSGSVTGGSGTTLNVTVTSVYSLLAGGTGIGPYTIVSSGKGYIDTWNTATSNYPSNSDVWWYYKDSTGVFNPSTTIANVTTVTAQAPQGHYILTAFNQTRSILSGVSSLTDVITTHRPRTGCWFQGRVWFTGVDDSVAATGTTDFYTWTENIYFSQIVNVPSDFGNCYQVNDPTSDNLNGLLPTDGGVITIQGAGSIYKLFPIQNGLLVFAGNGVWFITGSTGIGFAANDYTITKISSVQSISSTSFVDVFGLPYFWNEEGIYQVTSAQNGSLAVNSITIGVIESFYNTIPTSSKKLARAAFHPLDYVIQWIYKDTEATSITDSYSFDRILNYNIYNKAFYPYSVDISNSAITSIQYVAGPGGLNTPPPTFKYFAYSGTSATFADEHDSTYTDWASTTPKDYTSYFITGFKLRGQALKRFQQVYIQIYSRTNSIANGYNVQGIWDYSNSPNSGRWSTNQVTINAVTRYDTVYRRHKIRGRGFSLQFKVSSISGMPFDVQGWATEDSVNAGV